MSEPFLYGREVYLRPLEQEDLERCTRWVNDPDLTQFLYLGAFPMNSVQENEWFQTMCQSKNVILLAICTGENDTHIGMTGLHGIDFVSRFATLGIFIGEKNMQGEGYGTEAIELVLKHAFLTLNLNRVELTSMEFNERALGCYNKIGFVKEGCLRKKQYKQGKYCDEIVFSILRSEWQDKQPSE